MENQDTMQDIRLLLVDDEDGFRHTLAKRLQKRGYPCEHAASGEECLRLLAEKPVEIILLDVKMPGMNGIEVLHQIKKKYPSIEVILLTGHAATSDGVEGIKSGAFDYLTKPLELEHLVGKIKQAHEKMLRIEAERREAEFRARMEQQMIATERLASLGTLSTGVAHEINNPLAIISESVGWLKLLLNKDDMHAMPRKIEFANALAKIEKSVDRAKRITHQLLESVRKENSATIETDLGALVAETVALLAEEARHKELRIVTESHPARIILWTDPYQLRQVLINLVANACHATGNGGRITIAIKDSGEQIHLSVSDTGSGIPKENLAKIFEPFFTTKPHGQGTGLGLFVSRGIIARLGGEIQVQSQIGRGANFLIRLPKTGNRNRIETATAHGPNKTV